MMVTPLTETATVTTVIAAETVFATFAVAIKLLIPPHGVKQKTENTGKRHTALTGVLLFFFNIS